MKNKNVQRLSVIAFCFVSVLIISLIILWMVNGGIRLQTASRETIPIHILKVDPSDGQTLEYKNNYCVHFAFRAGNGMGNNPGKNIHFFFDGFDVTQSIDGLINMDVPPSGGVFCYKSITQFSAGWHSARVTYRDVTGKHFEYLWRFYISGE